MVSVLEKFGVISICILTIHLTRKMSDFFYKRSVSRYYKKQRLKELGQWGVVVGADKSIGQAYAVELAKQGLNVVIIGSNLHKLTTLSNLLEKYFQIQGGIVTLTMSTTIQVDKTLISSSNTTRCKKPVLNAFSFKFDWRENHVYIIFITDDTRKHRLVFTGVISLTFTPNEFKYIEKALWNLDVAILVNAPEYAVGVAQPECFLQVPEFDLALSSLVNKNLIVTTRMCAIVIPGMVSKGKGIIINVASVTLETSPLMALSEASAAYIEKLSEELQNQYSCTGVVIQSLLPGYALGNRLTKNNLMVPWAKDCIHRMIRSFGFEGEAIGRLVCFLVHTIQGLCSKTSDIKVKKLSAS